MKNLNILLKIIIMLFSKGYLYNKKSNRISNYSIKYNCKIISYICLDVNFYQMLPGSILPVLLLGPPGSPLGGHPANLHHLQALSRTWPTRPK